MNLLSLFHTCSSFTMLSYVQKNLLEKDELFYCILPSFEGLHKTSLTEETFYSET